MTSPVFLDFFRFTGFPWLTPLFLAYLKIRKKVIRTFLKYTSFTYINVAPTMHSDALRHPAPCFIPSWDAPEKDETPRKIPTWRSSSRRRSVLTGNIRQHSNVDTSFLLRTDPLGSGSRPQTLAFNGACNNRATDDAIRLNTDLILPLPLPLPRIRDSYLRPPKQESPTFEGTST